MAKGKKNTTVRLVKAEIERFRSAIEHMNYDSPVYKMLKESLSRLGYWKNRGRGKIYRDDNHAA